MATFQDYKRSLSIINVLQYLGYKLDKSKGLKYPSYVLVNGNKVIDRVQIINPNKKENQGFFRHDYSSGDLITFIEENINKFPIKRDDGNIYKQIFRVLKLLTNQEFDQTENFSSIPTPINLSDYQFGEISKATYEYLIKSRGIDKETVEKFSNNILECKYKDMLYKNMAYAMQNFESSNIHNLEIKGYNGYKTFASNSSKSNCFWFVNFAKNINTTHHVFIAESAIDIMSFFSQKKEYLIDKPYCFISLSGTWKNSTAKYIADRLKCPVTLLFDNDLPGRLFDIKFYLAVNDIPFSIKGNKENTEFKIKDEIHSFPNNELSLNSIKKLPVVKENSHFTHSVDTKKPPGGYKDWNDVIKPSIKSYKRTL